MRTHVFTLASHPSAAVRARAVLGALANETDPELLADLKLVVTELVSAAVNHGPGETITVTLRVASRTRVEGEIDDAAAIEEQNGLGLLLVQRLATRWGVSADSGAVWFELFRDVR